MVAAGHIPVEATFTILIRACVADNALDAAEIVLLSAKRRSLSPKLRTYSPLLLARCGHGELSKALALGTECMKVSVTLGEVEHCALVLCRGRGLRGDVGFEQGAIVDPRADALLDTMADDCHLPSRAAWDAAETYLGALGPAWSMRRDAKVSAMGTCSACSTRLRSVDLVPTGRALLLQEIEGLVPRAVIPCIDAMLAGARADDFAPRRAAQWVTYTQWLKNRDVPYDCVIDGANVGFHNGSRGSRSGHVDFLQIDSVVRHCVDLGRRCLVILHMRHLADHLPVSARPVVHAWRRAKILYSCGQRNNDDWYWLYAAVYGGPGTLLVSNDEMRDHHFGMLSARAFLIWKERHLTKFDLRNSDGTSEVVLRVPLPFSVRTQRNNSAAHESWHFPAPPKVPKKSEWGLRAPRPMGFETHAGISWFCCSRTLETNSRGEPEA